MAKIKLKNLLESVLAEAPDYKPMDNGEASAGDESEAAKEAHHLGLVSDGWGRWKDKSGNVVAKTVKGKLVKTDDGTTKSANAYNPDDDEPIPANATPDTKPAPTKKSWGTTSGAPHPNTPNFPKNDPFYADFGDMGAYPSEVDMYNKLGPEGFKAHWSKMAGGPMAGKNQRAEPQYAAPVGHDDSYDDGFEDDEDRDNTERMIAGNSARHNIQNATGRYDEFGDREDQRLDPAFHKAVQILMKSAKSQSHKENLVDILDGVTQLATSMNIDPITATPKDIETVVDAYGKSVVQNNPNTFHSQETNARQALLRAAILANVKGMARQSLEAVRKANQPSMFDRIKNKLMPEKPKPFKFDPNADYTQGSGYEQEREMLRKKYGEPNPRN